MEFQLISLSGVKRPTRIHEAATADADVIPFCVSAMAVIKSAGVPPVEQISAETIAAWYTAREAMDYAIKSVGQDGAKNALWQRLQAGLIQTAATTFSVTYKGQAPRPYLTPVFLPNGIWKHFEVQGSDLWNPGDARFWFAGRNYDDSVEVYCTGIRFNPEHIRDRLPPPLGGKPLAPPQPSASIESSVNKGGRPRKDFWDDLWAEICGQIYEGVLIPQRQADIEKAMLDWATNHGHDLSEAGARQRARILFNRLKTRG